MISAPVFPFADACQGVVYQLSLPPECVGSKITEYLIVESLLPQGVTPDDVIFSNPMDPNSTVIFPKEGTYHYYVKCWG